MKKRIYIFGILVFLAAQISIGQSFKVIPESPVVGEGFNIVYNPEGGELEGAMDIEIVAYALEGNLPSAYEVPIMLDKGVVQAKFMPNNATKAVFFRISSDEIGKEDNNNDVGYFTKIYATDGSMMQGTGIALGKIYNGNGRIFGVQPDKALALKYYQKEFKHFPESKNDSKAFLAYANLAKSAGDEAGMVEVKNTYMSLAGQKKKTEDSWMDMLNLAKLLDDVEDDDVVAIEDKIRKKFPKGDFVKSEYVNAFYKTRDTDARVESFKEYEKLVEIDDATLNNMARTLASVYGSTYDWENFDHYLSKITDPEVEAGVDNQIAWALSGESLEAEPINLEKGIELSKNAIMYYESSLDDLSKKPSYLTDSDYKAGKKRSYAMNADTYALLCYKSENYKTAYKYQKIAVEANDMQDVEMNERYVVYMDKVLDPPVTIITIEELIADGLASPRLKEMFTDYIETGAVKSDEIAALYLDRLESIAEAKLLQEIKEKMLSNETPSFELVNLEGESISLESLAGKTIVVDFWATWCGPCKASFPGMQTAVNNYADDESVEFLFVNTWERAEDKNQNARSFVESNNYTFNVLMDNDNKVVEAFEVSGIPTKFVIGPDGVLRFKSVGYGGNNDELVNELKMMIDLARKAAGVSS